MGLESNAPGATPLDQDEAAGLIPGHITTQAQLNAWEQSNILKGERWALSRRSANSPEKLLSIDFAKQLHRRMFGETWKWAGDFRLTEKTIGIAPHEISVALHNLLEDVKTQLQCKAYPLDEIAARLHHRMVYIHPFPNGNGRHSRLMADLLLVARGAARFTWGGKNIATAGDARKQYIFALQAADDKDNGPLLAFVRS